MQGGQAGTSPSPGWASALWPDQGTEGAGHGLGPILAASSHPLGTRGPPATAFLMHVFRDGARALLSGTGSWEAESPGTRPGSCPAAAQVRPACFLVICGQG